MSSNLDLGHPLLHPLSVALAYKYYTNAVITVQIGLNLAVVSGVLNLSLCVDM